MLNSTPSGPRIRLEQSSMEEPNAALRLYRRLPLDLLGMPRLSVALPPLYGLYLLSVSPTEWVLLAMLVAMFGMFRWWGRRIGTILQDLQLLAALVGALLRGTQVIATRAKVMVLE